jgi:hypothetical protein
MKVKSHSVERTTQMKVIKASYGKPDNDGDITVDCEVMVSNSTEHDVELVKISNMVLNPSGVAINGYCDSEEQVFIEPGSESKIYVNVPWINERQIGGKVTGSKISVVARLFRQEFHNLGELEVPKDHHTPTFDKTEVDLGNEVKLYGLMVYREEPDEDGDITLGVKAGIRNLSDTLFEKVEMKFSLINQKGAEVDNGETFVDLRPHSGDFFDANCWNMKAGKLKNTKVKVSLFVHHPVAFLEASQDLQYSDE